MFSPKQARSRHPCLRSKTGLHKRLKSLSIVDGSLTTGSFNASVKLGQRIQFLVHSNQTDSLIIEGSGCTRSLARQRDHTGQHQGEQCGHPQR
jgi:hypothetical protein